MNPRHGNTYVFSKKVCSGFGVLAQPLVYVHLRSQDDQAWTPGIAALVDTGASITLIKSQYIHGIPGFDANRLGPPLRWSSATSTATCRLAHLDIRLKSEPDAPVLAQCPIYFTDADLPEAILLGQRGVLDRLGLVHRNLGPRPYFRFTR